LVPMKLDLGRMQRLLRDLGADAQVPGLYRGLLRRGLAKAGSGAAQASALRARLSALPKEERPQVLQHQIQQEVASVLGLSGPEAVPPERPIKDLGLDSLMAVELRNRLNALSGLRLPATVTFEYPSAQALSGYLLEQVFSERKLDSAEPEAPEWPFLPEAFLIEAADGEPLHVHLSLPPGPGPHPAVVVHTANEGGALDDRGRYTKLHEHMPLVEAGFAVLTVDQRGAPGHGESYGARYALGSGDIQDLVGATRWMANRVDIDGDRIGLLGTSRGAYASLIAASQEPGLWCAVVLRMGFYDPVTYFENEKQLRPAAKDSPFSLLLEAGSSWDQLLTFARTLPQPLGSLKRVRAPLFVLHGEADRIVPISDAERLERCAEFAEVPLRLLRVPELGHDIFEIDARWPHLWKDIIEFLHTHLTG
jgi:alpha-beta hydrolase superfamily lysophospholipase/acyl carrier protein